MAQAPSAAERAAVDRVRARLAGEFPELPAAEIDRAVAGHYESFGDCAIREFVPVLVERGARQQLRNEHPNQPRD